MHGQGPGPCRTPSGHRAGACPPSNRQRRLADVGRQRQPTDPAALPADRHLTAAPVHIGQLKRSDLTAAQAKPREDGQGRVVTPAGSRPVIVPRSQLASSRETTTASSPLPRAPLLPAASAPRSSGPWPTPGYGPGRKLGSYDDRHGDAGATRCAIDTYPAITRLVGDGPSDRP